ncbi:hypothetical protein, partial [Planomonospora algeriensis]
MSPPPTKTASGDGRPASAAGRPGHHAQLRDAEPGRVPGDPGGAGGITLHRDGPVGPVPAHPLDRDAPGARADVPEQLAGDGREAGQGHRAHLPLGELAVVREGVVGQAGDARQRHGPGIGPALDRDDVQVVRRGQRPAARRPGDHALLGTAEAFQDGHRAAAVPVGGEQRGDPRGG